MKNFRRSFYTQEERKIGLRMSFRDEAEFERVSYEESPGIRFREAKELHHYWMNVNIVITEGYQLAFGAEELNAQQLEGFGVENRENDGQT